MSDRMNSVVMGGLMILLLINLIFPVVYHFFKPAPVDAATTATYKENWNADKVIVTNTNPYSSTSWWRSCCWWWWTSYYLEDSSYVETTPGGMGSYWSGRSYWYYWNVSPHGLVTEWSVYGTLTK